MMGFLRLSGIYSTVQVDHSRCFQSPVDIKIKVLFKYEAHVPLFWCQREVGNNMNGHPVYHEKVS